MEELPKSILIIGGGIFACEIRLHPQRVGGRGHTALLRRADPCAASTARRAASSRGDGARGVDLHLGTNIVEMRAASEVTEFEPEKARLRDPRRHRRAAAG